MQILSIRGPWDEFGARLIGIGRNGAKLSLVILILGIQRHEEANSEYAMVIIEIFFMALNMIFVLAGSLRLAKLSVH